MSLVFLIGLPGCGKTHWGGIIAEKLDYAFVDTDVLVEKQENKTITKIFATTTEDYFRVVERKVLLDLIKKTKVNTVIACGGGLPTYKDNLDEMKKAGCVVYLQCEIEVLAERIQKQKNRPLMNVEGDLHKQLIDMYEVRMPYYIGAHHIVQQDEITIRHLKELINHV